MSEWIEWNGGDCPVGSDVGVLCKYRVGGYDLQPIRAGSLTWKHTDSGGDIVAFKKSNAIKPDPINHPAHYTSHPSGVECITVTEHMGFNLGNAVKCIWRADLKADAIEDLKKARWYIDRELKKRGADERPWILGTGG